jgi:predicted nucleotidyltransferase
VRNSQEDSTKGLVGARRRYALNLEEAVKRATECLSALPEVRRVSLFGSYARGRRDLFTDLDLLVIMDTDVGVVDRLRDLYALLSLPVDYDLVCYTPAEWEQLQDRTFWRRARQSEVVLYERG